MRWKTSSTASAHNHRFASKTMPQYLTEPKPSAVVTSSEASWRCVQSGNREGWLTLMADDNLVEDPIGPAVTNPA